jgi:two-component system OmpR family response regulator
MSDKKRLLLIDDEEPFTRIAKLNLEQTGRYEVRIENDATRALDVAREFRPDLILLDVIMPEMDGGEVAGKIREDAGLREVPVVYLTAAVSREELGAEWGEIGGRKFIAKPVSLRSLLAAIEREVGTPG